MSVARQNTEQAQQQHPSEPQEEYDLGFLRDLYRAWKEYWHSWLLHSLQGKPLPRQAEMDLHHALHDPENRLPVAQRKSWHEIQQECHDLLHRLQSWQALPSNSRHRAHLLQAIDAAFQLERRCFDQLIEQAQIVGQMDELTRLPNRRRMQRDLLREQAIVERGGHAFLAMIDLDHFKVINDSYGHPFGDQVLQQCAQSLRSTLRPYDGLYRYGGEEFLVILPRLAADHALSAGNRIRQAVERQRFDAPNGDIPQVTIAVGMAALLAGHDPLQRLAMADTALYQAKRSGRNRVVVA